MIYLLDTHFVLWSMFDLARIPTSVRAILENDSDSKLVSGVNLWEISLKYALGKLDLGGITPSVLFDTLQDAGFEFAALENRLLATYHKLPSKADHRDPFDRLLVWQAISNDYILISRDPKVGQYRNDGLRVLLNP